MKYSLGWRKGLERPEKWRYRLVPPRTPDYTKQRSLANLVTTLFDQGGEGSCTANAGCLAAMMVAVSSGTPTPVLSRMWKYYQERVELGSFPQDSGADVVDEYDSDKSPGEIADSVWPYPASNATEADAAESPPAAAKTAATYKPIAGWQPIAASDFRDGILTALDAGQPVSIGLNVWNGWETAWEQTGIWTKSGMTQGIAGGHAVVIIGWVPPNAQFSQGAYLVQNSWGATSPTNTAIHPDCTPGRLLLDAATFALSQVGGEANAVVGQNTPAILSVTVTPPAAAIVGQPSAWSATVVGAPAGTQLSYSWLVTETGWQQTASGQNVSISPKQGGMMTAVCTVSVATTGATATANASVMVSVAPTPSPTPTPPSPTPTPTPTPVACRVSAQTLCVAQAEAVIAAYDAGSIDYPEAIEGWDVADNIYVACAALPSLPGDAAPSMPPRPVRHR